MVKEEDVVTDFAQVYHGDCLSVMAAMEANSVDSLVTDPPYGLSFMGKGWDHGVPGEEFWREALRVAKPGAHLLAFGGTRTFHRLAVAIEDAGWEIRDTLMWVYGSGFPKSLDVSKAIDKAAGAERKVVVGSKLGRPGMAKDGSNQSFDSSTNTYGTGGILSTDILAPSTDAAKQWDGWGTALKPAWEPIILARKPLEGTVAQNVQKWGVGALNIDGCRVAAEGEVIGPGSWSDPSKRKGVVGLAFLGTRIDVSKFQKAQAESVERANRMGRWPANLVHDGSEEVLELFPTAKSDEGSAARFFQKCQPDSEDDLWQDLSLSPDHVSTAGLSSCPQRQAVASALALVASAGLPEELRCAVAFLEHSTSATGAELRKLSEVATRAIQSFGARFWHESEPARLSLSFSHANVVVTRGPIGTTTITISHWKYGGSADPVTFSIMPASSEVGGRGCTSRMIYCAKASQADRNEGLPDGSKNTHPTVKPTALMRYLCRMVTPPGGLVLDPFCGSGSTGKAALLEGYRFAGIDLDAVYVEIARERLSVAGRRGLLHE